MPSIMAVPYPTRGHVLLEINFADVPTVTNVCVTATDTVTGVTRPLHPYVSYNTDGCIALSCGQAIMWDTEISCGNATEYCATAVNSAGETITVPAPNLITATFSTVAVASWPPADTGQVWTNTGGLAANYSGTGSRGQHAVTTANVDRLSTVPMTTSNARAQVTMIPGAVATVSNFEMQLRLRSDVAALNYYRIVLSFNTAGTVDLSLRKLVAGVNTTIVSSAAAFPYTAATQFHAVLQTWGSQIKAKVWDATTPEPEAWTFEVVDTSLTSAGLLGLASWRNAANTNAGLTAQYDNLFVTDVCADPVPVERCTGSVTIACDGCFRLSNPVRPCSDIHLCLCADGVACGGEGGVFFVAMTPDTRASNSGSIEPVNDIYPIPVNRRRMKPTSNLTVVPTSFVARDDLVDLLAPGEPLLLRTTPEFGIGDRYLQVGDVPESYQISDMTIQPRIMNLPNAEVRAPVGPTLGVCGARVTDLCDVYSTWDAIAAAGLTWADLLRGNASTTPAGLETWNSVNAENASWNALQAAQSDWADVLDNN